MMGAIPAAAVTASSAIAAPQQKGPRMGGTSTAFTIRSAQARAAKKEFDQLEHCHALGMGGAEIGLPSLEPEEIKKLRAKLESYNMYISANGLRLPNTESDLPAFEKLVKGFVEAGAKASRCPMTQRRYEQYKNFQEFKADFDRQRKMVQLAEPIARKYKFKIGIENHKGQRFAEFMDWIKGVGSEWVGVCFDIGNNYALCDDTMEWLPQIAPYTVNVHIKDMALGDYKDGFLLSEVVLGQGIMDLKLIVDTIRKQHPDITFGLEHITRDPLQIPVYTEQYWAVFDEKTSPLPGRDLAHILNLVRTRGSKQLPYISQLSPADQLKAEDDNISGCIKYATANLGL
jgi:3-oxoisoapionate decarboxylase